MKNLIVLVLLLVGTSVFAQNERTLKFNEDTNLIEATYYNENGNIVQTGFYTKEGKLQGDWISYDNEGNKKVSAQYNNGEKTGKWFYWSKDTLNEVDYSNNTVANVNTWITKNSIADRELP
ncbi:toxin-antitoxin system YwqK family antitoxin [Aurantibacter aestuarii]|uniref:Nicotinic acid mononucleotide adenyltransferase n=1 Tax=Aurantibacter aestuarii TaxID=1266046 RepID=A0A2T1NC28_9FLAO|nr:nicotinic acid mononucleotide adenyltransferase [Aurantibacter aestuarii]PSG89990.1 nicotinic acid mononucleotide adenyltransferase [Aurantibacter aestuarii]